MGRGQGLQGADRMRLHGVGHLAEDQGGGDEAQEVSREELRRLQSLCSRPWVRSFLEGSAVVPNHASRILTMRSSFSQSVQ